MKKLLLLSLILGLSSIGYLTSTKANLVKPTQLGSNPVTFTKINSGKIVADLSIANGASWIDYNNDGLLDMYVVNNINGKHKNFLYQNNGDGTFLRIKKNSIVKSSVPNFGSSWADYDNDGDLDLYLTGSACALYQNDGQGNFTKITTGDISDRTITGYGVSWGDYDNDGNLDLLVANPGAFFGNRKSNFLFHNDGPPNYTFTNVTNTPITTKIDNYTVPTWTDFDNDGDLDLFISNGPANGTTGPNKLYKNLLKETQIANFEEVTTGIIVTDKGDGQVGSWFDYDNDGDLDLYVTNFGVGPSGGTGLPNSLYRNDGGTYTKITLGKIVTDRNVSLASVTGDFDNDGDLDVYVATGGPVANRYYQNNGDGTFTSIETGEFVTEAISNFGATAGDYDNDGFLDLFVANVGNAQQQPGKSSLFKNNGNSNHWINILCVGTKSNRSAIGAKLKALATIDNKPVWQMREISSQDTFCGQSSLNVEFGFGNSTEITTLIVEWPSGIIDTFNNLPVDKFITITEGETIK